MRPLLVLAALCAVEPALAGGIGLIGSGGFHQEKVFYYDHSRDDLQFSQPQLIGTGAGGIEIILGDRDDRVLGIFRGYYAYDAAQRDPANSSELVAEEDNIRNWRDKPRHIGMGSVGLSWGFVGNPDRWQITAVADVGSGFITSDHREFIFGEVGVGFTYRLNRQIMVHAEAMGLIRFFKVVMPGSSYYAGVRYMFD